MSEKKKRKESLLVKRGVFVTLVAMVAVMLITLVMNLILPTEEKEMEITEEEILQSSVNPEEVYRQKAVAVHAPMIPTTVGEAESPEVATETDPPKREIPAQTILERPVAGEIQKDHAPEELVYSETMQDWRVHEGVDFSATEGEEVRAAADGVVEEVLSDGMMGAMVRISHPDGLKTIYANLQAESLPAAGEQIRMGEMIGKVGETATLEINDGPHLHFEVWKEGVCTDPKPFFSDLAPAM